MLDNDDALAKHYNIESYYFELSGDLRRAYRDSGLRAGSMAPPFELTTIDGAHLSSQQYLGHKAVVLIFGSYSAPPVQRETPEIDAIYKELDHDHVELLFVYTREIHPSQPMAPGNFSLPHHETIEQKVAAATMMRDDLKLTLPVCVDDLMGTVHRAYGSLPFFQVIIDREGMLIHRSEWTNPTLLSEVLENLDQRKNPPPTFGAWQRAYTETIWGTGKVSAKDYRPGSL